MGFWKKSILFYLGGSVYMALEFLWRGRSHGSMFLLGGTCFLVIGKLSRLLSRMSQLVQLVVYSGAITFLELITGLLVNRQYLVWDYRRVRYNYRGQICLPYFLLWMPVSLVAREVYRAAEKGLDRADFSDY